MSGTDEERLVENGNNGNGTSREYNVMKLWEDVPIQQHQSITSSSRHPHGQPLIPVNNTSSSSSSDDDESASSASLARASSSSSPSSLSSSSFTVKNDMQSSSSSSSMLISSQTSIALLILVKYLKMMIQRQDVEAEYQHLNGDNNDDDMPTAGRSTAATTATSSLVQVDNQNQQMMDHSQRTFTNVVYESSLLANQQQQQQQRDFDRYSSSSSSLGLIPTNKYDVLLSLDHRHSFVEGSKHQQYYHTYNNAFYSTANQLAVKYCKIKRKYKQASIDVLYNTFLHINKTRFWKRIQTKHHGIKYRRIHKSLIRKKMKRDFYHACKEEEEGARRCIDKEEEEEQDETMELEDQPSSEETTKTNISSCCPSMLFAQKDTSQRTTAPATYMPFIKGTHCILDLTKVDHINLFSFSKSLSSSECHIESMEVCTAPMSLGTASVLSWGIESCRSLKQVKLRFSSPADFDSHHCDVLFKGMLRNVHIESININDNNITPALCNMIVDLILDNTPKNTSMLSRLTLEGNPIGDDGSMALCRLVEQNTTIRYLGIGWNAMSQNGLSQLMKQCEKKRYQYLFELSGVSSACDCPVSDNEDDACCAVTLYDTPHHRSKRSF